MIRIDLPEPLLDRIRRENPTWLTRAEEKRLQAVAAGQVTKGAAIWSEIKGIFIEAQHYKCAYCELPMAKITTGETEGIGVDYDIDHFRPKNRVSPWPTAEIMARRPGLDYAPELRAGHADGYVRIAFDPLNYLVACKLCNSTYKHDRFPILGSPDAVQTIRRDLDIAEQPLLLFPLGEDGDEPGELLDFRGASIGPREGLAPTALLRARGVIDFFELDSREDLLEGRALAILLLFPELEKSAAGEPEAAQFVAALQEARFPHAACARAYAALYSQDREEAKRFFAASRNYLRTKDPSIWG